MYAHLTMVSPATLSLTANAMMAERSGIPDLQVLSVPLVPIDSAPGTAPTHFAGSGPVGVDMVPYLFDAQILSDVECISLERAQWLLSKLDVTYLPTSPFIPDGVVPESFDEVLARMGLKRPDLIENGL